ncbi:hypothetical protein [Streptomyces sp. NPDC058305]
MTPAGTADRDAAREFLWRLRVRQPQITRVWATGELARGCAVPR